MLIREDLGFRIYSDNTNLSSSLRSGLRIDFIMIMAGVIVVVVVAHTRMRRKKDSIDEENEHKA